MVGARRCVAPGLLLACLPASTWEVQGHAGCPGLAQIGHSPALTLPQALGSFVGEEQLEQLASSLPRVLGLL